MDLSEKSESQNRHPWEVSRMEMLLRELKDLKVYGKVLDIGCGDRYFDRKMLSKFPEITEIWGIDIYSKRNIHKGKENYVNSYEAIEGQKFNYVLMMDVLEHIEDDVLFMKNLHKYLENDTVILLTVPAFQSLYSLHDEQLHHYRRYNFKTLRKTLKASGYRVNNYSYFYLSLIFIRIISRKKTQNLGLWNRSEKSIVTRLIKLCLNADFFILRKLSKIGIHIGGLSLLALCRQDNS